MNTSMSLGGLKDYILPLIAVITIVILVPLLIMPSITDVQVQYKKNQDDAKVTDQLSQKIDKLGKMDNNANVQKLNDVLEPAIPSNPDPAGLLGSLEQVALTSGASVKSSTYNAGTTGKSGDSGEIAAELVVEGPYQSISTFVAKSENSSRLVSLTSFRMSVPSTGGNIVSATFEVSSPYENVSNLGSAEDNLPADLIGSPIYQKISNLSRAAFSPTPITQISGKSSPF